ncbi:hypothetical protein [Thioclava sp. GXIMD4215]|uniref:hypothetical protein n=1 Tax=Thioclava sp. GXIMD4215 TaxID=3131928 RepID=UPI00325469DC
MRYILQGFLILGLTFLTQIGGVAWLLSLSMPRRTLRLALFALSYLVLWAACLWLAPLGDRVALPCHGTGHATGPLEMRSWLTCALNRNYVTPDLKAALERTAQTMQDRHPGTITQVLDANFPFLDGFPLLPHLSHKDGRKADLALYYMRDGQYLAGKTRSPIGYFAFQQGPSDCPRKWPTLRWDMGWLQGLFPDYQLDPLRTRDLLAVLQADPAIGKVFLEPHLLAEIGANEPKIRFQGCRAARYDDHLHLQLAPRDG